MKAHGRVLCITGVSGSGKGTIVNAIRERRPELWFSTSVTTRDPRPGEVDGEHYHFVSDAEFDRMIAQGELVEWVEIYGHRSGTPKMPIDDAIAAGRTVLLEIETQGAQFVKTGYPESTVVFLRLSDSATQRERLQSRGTSGADLELRLREAEWELAQAHDFDAIVVNDELATAIDQVETILFPSAPPPDAHV